MSLFLPRSSRSILYEMMRAAAVADLLLPIIYSSGVQNESLTVQYQVHHRDYIIIIIDEKLMPM